MSEFGISGQILRRSKVRFQNMLIPGVMCFFLYLPLARFFIYLPVHPSVIDRLKSSVID
jgi:hypothetical protein